MAAATAIAGKKLSKKSKTKKKSSFATTQQAASGKSSSGGVYVVKVKEYVPMAQTIAAAKDQKVMPIRILELFKRCIEARGSVGEWYESGSAAHHQLGEKHINHAYFVDVLRNTLQVLVPLSKLEKLTKDGCKVPKANVDRPIEVGKKPVRAPRDFRPGRLCLRSFGSSHACSCYALHPRLQHDQRMLG